MRRAIHIFVHIVLLMSFSTIFAQDDVGDVPDVVNVQLPGIIPEGLEYDALNDRFLLSSMANGTVYSVADDGEAIAFITLDADMDYTSSVGMYLDTGRNRLLVTHTNYFAFVSGEGDTSAGLGAYDLDSGELLWISDLQALLPDDRHFINDVTIDQDGNAYVTDSLTPTIFKVDTEGNASIFLTDEELDGTVDYGFGPLTFTLNGIAYVQDSDNLIVSNIGRQRLLSVPVSDPENFVPIPFDTPLFIDGLDMDGEGNLIAVDAASGNVLRLTSGDGWESAMIDAISPDHMEATTSAPRGDTVYVVNAYLGASEPPQSYEIVALDWQSLDVDEQ